MDLELLNCSICPKQPSFSDTSHLLTHISSKGHLSQWHKLQVRSFQDIAASLVLVNYNQWCRQHDIDRLLSERMQMKEEKQAKKRGTGKTRIAAAPKSVPIDQTLLDDEPAPSERPSKSSIQTQKRVTRGRKRKDSDDSDAEFSPVKRTKPRAKRVQLYSSPKRSQYSDGVYPSLDDCPAEDDPAGEFHVLATPEHIKLKGIKWPGMDLFDAATQEMQQKRNQKKDVSVLRRMERLAGLVVPAEVVYSPNGDSMLKARHIDDLEDASSLIEGETPIPKAKQPQPRKRKPLAEKHANAPRLVKRKVKTSAPKKYADLPFAHGLPPLPYLPSSSTGDSYGVSSRYFPTEQDEDIKPSIESLVPRKRPPPQFEIFTEGSPRHNVTNVAKGTRNPLQPRGYNDAAFPQLPKVSAAWLQPHYQSALQFTDPYTSYRPVARQYQTFYEPSIANENLPPMAEAPYSFRGPATNSLSWKSPIRSVIASGFSPIGSPLGNLFSILHSGSPGDDPFVSTKNPLARASGLVKDVKVAEDYTHTSTDTGSSSQTGV